MFQNKLTCPHCKEEVATVGFRYSPKQWLFVLPILVIGLYHLFSLTFFKSYAQDDLQISSFETKIEGDHLDVIGVISNVSENAWTSVSVEGEFYDADGNFIGERKDFIGSDIFANQQENFEVQFRNVPEAVLSGEGKTVLKIVSGVCSDLF